MLHARKSLVMPGSRRTAGPRTALPAGSRHDAIRLKPAFTGRHHMNARLGVHNQVNLDPSTLGSKAARLAAGSGRRTRRVSGPGRHTARFWQHRAATKGHGEARGGPRTRDPGAAVRAKPRGEETPGR